MATKPRHRKTETQLWVYDNAKRLNLTELDLAKATGVVPGTARSWFSRGKPNADAMPILEKLFGRPAPEENVVPEGQTAIVAEMRLLRSAVEAQTEAQTRGMEALGEVLAAVLVQLAAAQGRTPDGSVAPRAGRPGAG